MTTNHPQALIDAVAAVFAECIGVDGMVPMHEYDDEARRSITAVRDYDAQHPTPAPDVSDEALAQLFTNTMARHVIDHRGKGYIEGTGLLAGIQAVRQALASSSAAVDVPEDGGQ